MLYYPTITSLRFPKFCCFQMFVDIILIFFLFASFFSLLVQLMFGFVLWVIFLHISFFFFFNLRASFCKHVDACPFRWSQFRINFQTCFCGFSVLNKTGTIVHHDVWITENNWGPSSHFSISSRSQSGQTTDASG